jgi:photosystem II stability/assembly factor-like uncharacterized protein
MRMISSKIRVNLVRILFIFLIFYFPLNFLHSQTSIWTRIGPFGADIKDIKVKRIDSTIKSNNGTLNSFRDSVYVACYGSGVFVNDSALSVSWISRNNGLPTRKVLCFAKRRIEYGDTLFVGLDGYGVYKTIDAGLNWTPANGSGANSIASRRVFAIAATPNHYDSLIAATDQGLWSSVDAGVTWNQIVTTLPIPTTVTFSDVVINEYHPQRFYASSGMSSGSYLSKLYYSNDFGGTAWQWTINSTKINCLSLALTSTDSLYCGLADGKLYELTSPTLPTITKRILRDDPVYPILSIDLDPRIDSTNYDPFIKDALIQNAADTILLGTKNGFIKLIRQINNTYSPTQINTGLNNVMLQKICYYPNRRHPFYFRENNYFAGTKFNGIYGLGNPQTTYWTGYNSNLASSGLRVVSTSPLNSNFVYAGGGFDLNYSYDGNGAVWKSPNASISSISNVYWSRVFPSQDTASSGKVITGITNSYASTNILWVSDSLSGIFRTMDGGINWTKVYDSSGVSALYTKRFVGTQPSDESLEVIFAARRVNGYWYIYRSINGGGTFHRMSTRFTSPITSIIADSATPQYIYATTWGAGVYRSTDNGSTFTRITNAIGSYNLNVYMLAVDSSYNDLTIGTEYGIYKSSDRGLTWLDDNSGIIGSGYIPDKVPGIFATRDTIWASLSGAGIYYRTRGSVSPQISKWTNASTDLGPGFAYSLSPYDSILFRGMSMSWKWNSSYNNMPIEGFAASEINGIFRRINNGTNIPFSNGRGIGSIDSIYVYIPDTASGIRGEKVDIPIRIRNASFVDSFRVTVHVPIDYLISIDTTITQGTLTHDLSFTRSVNQIDNGMCRWVFNTDIPFGTNNDTVLFKIRYNIDNQSNIGNKNDSLPRSSNLYDSSIHICAARLDGSTSEDSTDFLWRSPANQNQTHLGLPGTDDSIGVLWLRKLPDFSTNNNGLPGMRSTALDDVTDTTGFSRRGDQGNLEWGNANFSSEHDWAFVRNIQKNMIIYIMPSAKPTYPYLTSYGLQENSIRTGDAIGAFYYKLDSLVCGGWGIWRADLGCVFTIYGDDDQTLTKDGFIENEQINFKIYDSRYKKVWPVPSIYTKTSYGSSVFRTGLRAEFDSTFQGKTIQSMIVDGRGPSADGGRGGWHLVSSYVYPVVPNNAVADIFRLIDYFLLLKDQTPSVYWPAQGVEQILYWDVTKAYWIYLSRNGLNERFSYTSPDQILIFKGPKLDPSLYPIPFTTAAKWYLIPYLGNIRYPIGAALSTISGKYTLVQDDSGAIYWPAAGIDQISNMIPGKGYAIYMTSTDTLTYPSAIITSLRSMGNYATIPELSPLSNGNENSHFKIKATSPINQIIGIKINGMTLRNGDEIGVINKYGVCAGTTKYIKNKNNQIAITVFGNDEFSSAGTKSGTDVNDELTIRVYSKNENKEYSAKISSIKWITGKGENLVFKPGSIVQLEVDVSGKILPMEYSLEQNYPNPFNPTTTIKYSIPNDGLVKLKVYDLLGREVKELLNSNQIAGYYTIEWDGTNNNGIKAASGVYFYKLESEGYKKSLKMILMK